MPQAWFGPHRRRENSHFAPEGALSESHVIRFSVAAHAGKRQNRGENSCSSDFSASDDESMALDIHPSIVVAMRLAWLSSGEVALCASAAAMI